MWVEGFRSLPISLVAIFSADLPAFTLTYGVSVYYFANAWSSFKGSRLFSLGLKAVFTKAQGCFISKAQGCLILGL